MSKTTFTLKRKQYAIPGLGFGSAAFKQISKTNSFGKNAALAGKGALGALGSTALVGGTLAAGGAALGKGVVSKASEQSDGSKVFSQVNNDNMATTYTLKRKTFSFHPVTGQPCTPQEYAAAMKKLTGKNTVAEISTKAGGATTFNQATKNALNTEKAKLAANNRAYAEFRGNTAGMKGIQRAQGGNAQKVYEAGRTAGAKSVGLKTAAMNTWKGMGTMGKAGVIGAGVVGAGLMAKGLFGGKKKDQ